MAFVYQILGWLLILIGLPLFWTPIPVGLVLIAVGGALLIANSDAARDWVRERRRRHPRFNAWVIKAERIVPHPFDRILQRTDVEAE
ncbi:MAG: hypothetical protein AAFX09_06705 [Pseudomonadota bacterium]